MDQPGEPTAAPPEPPGPRATGLRRLLGGVLPAHFPDPAGLALRLLRSGSADARAALVQAGLHLALIPVDAALAALGPSPGADEAPRRPVLLVTGPPRSGTTLLHELLIRALPVAYVTNLAGLMPRSAAAGRFPLVRAMRNGRVRLDSYYGRTRSLSGPNDGLEFWDAWLGPDRRAIPDRLTPGAGAAMRGFFGRMERLAGRPVVAKNNALLGCAHLVAEALPTARVVCLRRDPLFLAQSLLRARLDILGTGAMAYGIDDAADGGTRPDPVEDVWRQVALYRALEAGQAERLGDRLIVVSYEALCADPAGTVRHLGQAVFGHDGPLPPLPPLHASRARRLPSGTFERLVAARPAALR